MAKKLISEVLSEASQIEDRKARIAYLQQNSTPALKDIFRVAFDDTVVSVLPKGAPPYTPDDAPKGYEYSSLAKLHRRFKYFFKGPIANETVPLRREAMFVTVLESLHAEEAELLISAKDKKLKYKGVTKKLVCDAFPNLIVK